MDVKRQRENINNFLSSVIKMMAKGHVPEDEAEDVIYNTSIIINDLDYLMEYYRA